MLGSLILVGLYSRRLEIETIEHMDTKLMYEAVLQIAWVKDIYERKNIRKGGA